MDGFTEYPSDAFLTGRGGALSTIALNEKGHAYGVATFAQSTSFQQDVANWGTVISRFAYDPECAVLSLSTLATFCRSYSLFGHFLPLQSDKGGV
jgi:hypothetical protein